MLYAVIISAVLFVIVLWFTFQIFNRHTLQLCKTIPSAQPCYPLLGNILLFACSFTTIAKTGRKVLKESVLNGHRSLCLWIGVYPLVYITNPDDIRRILNNCLCRGKEIEESTREYLTYGLLTSPVNHWKVTRRHLNFSFHPHNLDQLIPTFNLTSQQLVADLSSHVDGVAFNLMPHVMSAALRTICTLIYGTKILELASAEGFNCLIHSIELAGELMALRMNRPWLSNGIVFKLFYGKEINIILTGFKRFLNIASTNTSEREMLTDKEVCDSGARKGDIQSSFQTILNAMRELQDRDFTITDEHVFDEIGSFFAAGTETIGISVSSCLLALARFPKIQEKVSEEICSVVPEDEEYIAHHHLVRLNYIDQVIKETLRYFPVIPFTLRAPNRDMDLGGYTIPANKTVFLWIASVCFDPKYFPDPYKFDPDRFSTPSSSEDVFIPFGRGPRSCIGKTYALMLIKVIVAHVVRKYRLHTNMDVKNLKKKLTITLSLCDGYNVSLTKRCD